MNPATIVLLIIGIALILFITEIIPLSCTAMLVAVSFQLTGVIESGDTFKAFANQTTMIIASMAIIGEAVFRTGGAAKIGDIITKFAKSEQQVIFGTIILSSLMSGFLSNTGAAALLLLLSAAWLQLPDTDALSLCILLSWVAALAEVSAW